MINFLIIAFVVFLLVKAINKVIPKPEKKPAETHPSAEESLEKIVKLLEEERK